MLFYATRFNLNFMRYLVHFMDIILNPDIWWVTHPPFRHSYVLKSTCSLFLVVTLIRDTGKAVIRVWAYVASKAVRKMSICGFLT